MIRFSEDIAVKYGMNAAIVSEFLWELIWDCRLTNDVTSNYGSEWVRYSQRKMASVIKCLSVDMVKEAIKVLTDEGIIRKDNFNYSKFDHTNWYSFTDFGDHLMRRSE